MSKRSISFSDVTAVIPTLNEAKAIGRVIDEVLSVSVPRGEYIGC